MRSFQLMFWIVFIVVYTFITWGSLKNVHAIISRKVKNRFTYFFIGISAFIILALLVLYVWPGDIRTSGNYNLYSSFNAILFLDVILKVPLAFLYVLALCTKKDYYKKVFSWVGIVTSSIAISIILYGVIIGKNEVRIKEVELQYKNLPKSFDGYKIAQFTDIHLGSLSSETVIQKTRNKLKSKKPDLILFTGDLVNNFSEELEGWGGLFKAINEDGNSYSILGNHDYGNYSNWQNKADKTDNFNLIIEAHKEFGFKLLNNENIKLFSGKDSIYLVGVENWGHPPFPQYANLEEALSGISDEDFTILMTHDPAHWESKIEGKKQIELTLSGHTHGLQWRVKPAGIPFSLSYFVRKNWGGLYKSNDTYLYVNTGLGIIGVPYRIDIPAEITLFTLKRIEID